MKNLQRFQSIKTAIDRIQADIRAEDPGKVSTIRKLAAERDRMETALAYLTTEPNYDFVVRERARIAALVDRYKDPRSFAEWLTSAEGKAATGKRASYENYVELPKLRGQLDFLDLVLGELEKERAEEARRRAAVGRPSTRKKSPVDPEEVDQKPTQSAQAPEVDRKKVDQTGKEGESWIGSF